MREPAHGLSQSVQTRLVTHAKRIDVDPNVVLARYATERLLHRLSRSRYADRFVLKGGLMLIAWLGEFTRPTRDADLLGYGDLSFASLEATFREICDTHVEPDGLTFDQSTLRVAPIRHDDDYGGWRVVLVARLGPARLRVQVDVGIGDAVEPPPRMLDYPSLLDAPRPRLLAYQPETTIAEKFHAMVELGEANSRLRDFFDVRVLAERRAFDGATLARAIASTFRRRGTTLGPALPIALTPLFAAVPGKREQWAGFLRKSRLPPDAEFDRVVAEVARFLRPVADALMRGEDFAGRWSPSGPWEGRDRRPAP